MNWRDVIHSYPCDVCGARAGEACRSRSGNRKREPHASRGRAADRCPRCGDRLSNQAEPGDICERCRLIRHLEIERATTWQRRT